MRALARARAAALASDQTAASRSVEFDAAGARGMQGRAAHGLKGRAAFQHPGAGRSQAHDQIGPVGRAPRRPGRRSGLRRRHRRSTSSITRAMPRAGRVQHRPREAFHRLVATEGLQHVQRWPERGRARWPRRRRPGPGSGWPARGSACPGPRRRRPPAVSRSSKPSSPKLARTSGATPRAASALRRAGRRVSAAKAVMVSTIS